MFSSRSIRLTGIFATLVVALAMVSVDQAEARRGGSFGSRGMRTFQTAPATPTAPNVTAPMQRSMTPAPAPRTNAAPVAQQQRPSFMNGFGGTLMRGLFFGGLLGLLFGFGFGGLGGLLSLLFQLLLIGGAIWLLLRLFGTRRSPALAGGPRGPAAPNPYEAYRAGYGSATAGAGAAPRTEVRRAPKDEVGIAQADLDRFEAALGEVQSAYGREDYTALRRLTTPEMMSYLSEELAQNASNGLKNEVSGIKLLQGDLSESWREGNRDYATVAMRYSSVDATRERASGRIVDGNADEPTETTELWTFTRQRGGDWLLSAIQQA